MTTDRPYRAAMPDADARQELREHAGTQFDSDVVRAFLDVLEDASLESRPVAHLVA